MSAGIVVPQGAHALIPDSDRVRPIWVDIGKEYDKYVTDALQPLQQTLQWFMGNYDAFFGQGKPTARFNEAVDILELFEESVKLATKNRFTESIDALEQTVNAAKASFAADHPVVYTCAERLVQSCVSFGLNLGSSGKSEAALSMFQRADMHTRAAATPFPGRPIYRCLVMHCMAAYFYRRQKSSAALHYSAKALKLETTHFPSHTSVTLLRVAANQSALGRHNDAIMSIRKSLAAALDNNQQSAQPPPQPKASKAGKKKRRKRKGNQAKEAVAEPRQLPVPPSPAQLSLNILSVIAAFHNLAVEHVFIRKYQKALTSIERAVELAVGNLAEQHPWMKRLEKTLREVMELVAISEIPTQAPSAAGDHSEPPLSYRSSQPHDASRGHSRPQTRSGAFVAPAVSRAALLEKMSGSPYVAASTLTSPRIAGEDSPRQRAATTIVPGHHQQSSAPVSRPATTNAVTRLPRAATQPQVTARLRPNGAMSTAAALPPIVIPTPRSDVGSSPRVMLPTLVSMPGYQHQHKTVLPTPPVRLPDPHTDISTRSASTAGTQSSTWELIALIRQRANPARSFADAQPPQSPRNRSRRVRRASQAMDHSADRSLASSQPFDQLHEPIVAPHEAYRTFVHDDAPCYDEPPAREMRHRVQMSATATSAMEMTVTAPTAAISTATTPDPSPRRTNVSSPQMVLSDSESEASTIVGTPRADLQRSTDVTVVPSAPELEQLRDIPHTAGSSPRLTAMDDSVVKLPPASPPQSPPLSPRQHIRTPLAGTEEAGELMEWLLPRLRQPLTDKTVKQMMLELQTRDKERQARNIREQATTPRSQPDRAPPVAAKLAVTPRDDRQSLLSGTTSTSDTFSFRVSEATDVVGTAPAAAASSTQHNSAEGSRPESRQRDYPRPDSRRDSQHNESRPGTRQSYISHRDTGEQQLRNVSTPPPSSRSASRDGYSASRAAVSPRPPSTDAMLAAQSRTVAHRLMTDASGPTPRGHKEQQHKQPALLVRNAQLSSSEMQAEMRIQKLKEKYNLPASSKQKSGCSVM
eukprot:TRINITY_DN9258_c0_g1_i1.p1 TRINITY_DN9258_c0_g1~~TRINITY_DN9258_c0_g1_i1.p1  ORF type:complete len:1037 (+),score=186.22 TRINITY_DN9258_c0_g1_i1:160-3270(+)